MHLKTWQPTHIQKCKITGDIQLFVAGKTRAPHDYTIWKESITPVNEAGGGAFSIQLFTLDALHTEFIKHRNFWTRGNQGLPLVRYTGGKFKFYKSNFTDYIVTISRCPPFSVTVDMFLNTHPQRMLLEKHKYIITRLKSNTKKRYKKIKFQPPSLMKNNWYFQQDMCKTPLLLLTVSACSFEQPYCPEDQISNNITLVSLNTDFFQNPAFEYEGTRGYIPKMVGTEQLYMWRRHNNDNPDSWKDVWPLCNTKTYEEGYTGHNNTWALFSSSVQWGNPFTLANAHEDEPIYYTNKWPTQSEYESDKAQTFTKIDTLYWTCRYNPDKDLGKGNVVYFKACHGQEQGTVYDLPRKEELVMSDYPLWLIFWGWIDFLQLSKAMQEIYSAYYFVVKSPYIFPQKKCYIFLDKYFYEPNPEKLTQNDRLKWHPKYEMQTEVEYYFGISGPFTPKTNRSNCLQANSNYSFFFKWGGCPAPMENIVPPCKQDKFPIPDPQYQGLEVQDPKTDKKTFLYSWDERHGYLTKKCAKRIRQDSDSELYVTGTSTRDLPIQTQATESDETETEEEDQTQIQNQLLKLKQQHKLFRQQLLRLRQKLE